MKKLKLSFSDAAVNDILEQADWYEQQVGTGLSARWERAVSSVLIRALCSVPNAARFAGSSQTLSGVFGAFQLHGSPNTLFSIGSRRSMW